jgi:hypothetical protein
MLEGRLRVKVWEIKGSRDKAVKVEDMHRRLHGVSDVKANRHRQPIGPVRFQEDQSLLHHRRTQGPRLLGQASGVGDYSRE